MYPTLRKRVLTFLREPVSHNSHHLFIPKGSEPLEPFYHKSNTRTL